jgi:hypothetical protein
MTRRITPEKDNAETPSAQRIAEFETQREQLLHEAEAVVVGVFDVDFASAPGLVDGADGDLDAFGNELCVELVDIVHEKIYDAAGDAVA